MNPQERQQLRLDTLKELYDYHFENLAENKSYSLAVLESEKFLALSYLHDKGLVNFNIRSEASALGRITSYGIDAVEEHLISLEGNEVKPQIAKIEL